MLHFSLVALGPLERGLGQLGAWPVLNGISLKETDCPVRTEGLICIWEWPEAPAGVGP